MAEPEKDEVLETKRLSIHAQLREENGIQSLASGFFLSVGLVTLFWILSMVFVWEFSVCAIIFLIPAAELVRWWDKYRSYCTLNELMVEYFHGFFNLALMAFFLQIVTILAMTLLFGFSGALDTHDYNTRWFVYITCCTVGYVAIEEVFKLSFGIHILNHYHHMSEVTKTHTLINTAAALGYATSTGLVWVFFTALAYRAQTARVPLGWLFIDTLIIAVIAMPLHLLTNYYVNLRISEVGFASITSHLENPPPQEKEDSRRASVSSYGHRHAHDDIHMRYLETQENLVVIIVPCVARTVFIWMLVLGVFVLQYNPVGLCLILVTLLLEYGVLVWWIKREERKLPPDYMQRTGKLGFLACSKEAMLDVTDRSIVGSQATGDNEPNVLSGQNVHNVDEDSASIVEAEIELQLGDEANNDHEQATAVR